MYHKMGIRNSQLILFGLGLALCAPVYIFYQYGPAIRRRSKWAMQLAEKREARHNPAQEVAAA
jgi:type II secretory pathway component PulM